VGFKFGDIAIFRDFVGKILVVADDGRAYSANPYALSASDPSSVSPGTHIWQILPAGNAVQEKMGRPVANGDLVKLKWAGGQVFYPRFLMLEESGVVMADLYVSSNGDTVYTWRIEWGEGPFESYITLTNIAKAVSLCSVDEKIEAESPAKTSVPHSQFWWNMLTPSELPISPGEQPDEGDSVFFDDVVCLRSIETGLLLTLGDKDRGDAPSIDVMAGQPSNKASMAHRWKITRADGSKEGGPVRNGDLLYLQAIDLKLNFRYLTAWEKNGGTSADITPIWENTEWKLEGAQEVAQSPEGLVAAGSKFLDKVFYHTSCIRLMNTGFSEMLCVKGDKVELVPTDRVFSGTWYHIEKPE
jgi:hypothetical protein